MNLYGVKLFYSTYAWKYEQLFKCTCENFNLCIRENFGDSKDKRIKSLPFTKGDCSGII